MPSIDNLLETIARLRAPDGCPWDREQTHRSLCDCLVEEVAEFIETVDLDEKAHMCEELGDLLLQVVMHAEIARERGDFSFEDIARLVNEKMIRRHPHVFGEMKLENSDAVLKKWDEIKAGEKSNSTKKANSALFKDLPASLNNILRARDTWKAVEKKNLNPGETANRAAIDALAGTLTEASAGEKLFEIVAACRQAKIDPDSALRRHIQRVIAACEANSTETEK